MVKEANKDGNTNLSMDYRMQLAFLENEIEDAAQKANDAIPIDLDAEQ